MEKFSVQHLAVTFLAGSAYQYFRLVFYSENTTSIPRLEVEEEERKERGAMQRLDDSSLRLFFKSLERVRYFFEFPIVTERWTGELSTFDRDETKSICNAGSSWSSLKRRISMRSYLLEESKEKWKREILPTNPFNPSPHSFRTLCRKFVQNFMRPFEFRIDYRGKRGRSRISTRASIINQPFCESWRN